MGLRILAAAILVIVGFIAIAALLIGLNSSGYLIVFPRGESHVEVLTLLLAAATLVITTVAIVVAVGAVVGYNAIKDSAEARAEDAASKLVKAYISQSAGRPTADDNGDGGVSPIVPAARPGTATREGDTL